MGAVDYYDLGVERWKRIPRWPAYEVSTWGNVKTYWKRTSGRGGGSHCVIGSLGKPMKPHLDKNGYRKVMLYDGSGIREKHFVAHLVLVTFVGPWPPGMEACHHPDPTR